MTEQLYQVRIIAAPTVEARQRIVEFLSSLAKHRNQEEIFQSLADLPFLLTSRASWKIASQLRERLEQLGASVDIQLLIEGEDSSNDAPTVSDPTPSAHSAVPLAEEDSVNEEDALSLPETERAESLVTLHSIEEREVYIYLEKRERKKFLFQLQSRAEEEGHIPPMPFLLSHKLSLPLQYMGGMLFGIFLGTCVLLFNYLFFVWLLHLEF